MYDYAKRFNQLMVAVNMPREKNKEKVSVYKWGNETRKLHIKQMGGGEGVQILYSTLSKVGQCIEEP